MHGAPNGEAFSRFKSKFELSSALEKLRNYYFYVISNNNNIVILRIAVAIRPHAPYEMY